MKRTIIALLVTVLLMSCQSTNTYQPSINIPTVESWPVREDIVEDRSKEGYVIISKSDYEYLIWYIKAVMIPLKINTANLEYMIDEVKKLE